MMKKIMMCCAVMCLAAAAWAEASRFVHAKADSNILNRDAEKDNMATDTSFLIDGDKTMGRVELVFTDDFKGAPKSALLIVNASDADYAESNDGFSVYVSDKKIGSSGKVARNSRVAVKLDPAVFAKGAALTLTLKADGIDGTYIRSLKSGFGPVLELGY